MNAPTFRGRATVALPSRGGPEQKGRERKGNVLPPSYVIAPVETVEIPPCRLRAAPEPGRQMRGRADRPEARLSASTAGAKHPEAQVPTYLPDETPGEQVPTCDYCGQPVSINVDWCREHPIHEEPKKLPTLFDLVGDERKTTKEKPPVKKKKAPRPPGRKLPRSRKVKTSRVRGPVKKAKRLLKKLKPKRKKKPIPQSRKGQGPPPPHLSSAFSNEEHDKVTAKPKRKKVNTSPPAVKPEPPKPKKCPRAEPHCHCCTKRPKDKKREKWETGPPAQACRNCGKLMEKIDSGKGGEYHRHQQYPSWRDKEKLPKGWKPCTA